LDESKNQRDRVSGARVAAFSSHDFAALLRRAAICRAQLPSAVSRRAFGAASPFLSICAISKTGRGLPQRQVRSYDKRSWNAAIPARESAALEST